MLVNFQTAEIMAIQALAYIAGREKALSYFLDQTGIAPQELKTRAGEPEVLAGVLDFLLRNEEILLDFCQETGTDPETVFPARHHFPGASEM